MRACVKFDFGYLKIPILLFYYSQADYFQDCVNSAYRSLHYASFIQDMTRFLTLAPNYFIQAGIIRLHHLILNVCWLFLKVAGDS